MTELRGEPMRLSVLLMIADEPMSPKDLSAILGLPIGRLSYHVRMMANAKLIRVQRQAKKRGAVQTFYTLTPKGGTLLAKLGLDEDGCGSHPS
jgi:DNA-binding transcriptional ArsR family regulator